jgi:hypothetical protein
MSDSVLDRFTRHLPKPTELTQRVSDSDSDELDDYGTFGWLRGVRERVPMLELRKANGDIRALGYAWLHQAEFDPSVGILLSFSTLQVRLRGRLLNAEVRPGVRLFQGILRHKVPYIQEADEATLMRSGSTDPVIERIEW